MHDEEAAGNLSLRLRSFAVGYGSMTDFASKQRTERSQTLKSNFEANIRHAQLVAAEQLFRFLDTTLDQILVWSLVECLPEETQEVITRETSLLGDLVQAQRMVVAIIDKLTRPTKPLKRFDIR